MNPLNYKYDTVKITIFLDMTPCNMVDIYQWSLFNFNFLAILWRCQHTDCRASNIKTVDEL